MIKNSLKDYEMPELDTSGRGLSILITSDYKHMYNWMAFASWYSIYKNLPEAKITIVSGRASKIDHYLYHWVYKCADLRYHLHKNISEKFPYLNKIYGTYMALKKGLIKEPFIVIDADTMAVSDLLPSTIKLLKDVGFATSPYYLNVGPIWYFRTNALEKIREAINIIGSLKGEHLDLMALDKVFGKEVTVIEELGNEVEEKSMTTFVHYGKGCGNFIKKDWNKGKTSPPFHVAYALQSVDMSVNEKKVLSLWAQMANLWDTVNQVKM